jgi:hypothetical protein
VRKRRLHGTDHVEAVERAFDRLEIARHTRLTSSSGAPDVLVREQVDAVDRDLRRTQP